MTDTTELSETAFFIWKNYNSKGISPPNEIIQRFKRLQGKSDEEIERIENIKKQKIENIKKQKIENDKKQTKQNTIDKLFSMMWKKYNLKGERPPLIVVKKIAKLQGKSQGCINTMKYEDFTGIIPPWKCSDDEYDEWWNKYKTPMDKTQMFSEDWLADTNHPKKMNAETTLEELSTGKALFNPTPLYEIRPSNRGYIKVVTNSV